MLPTASTDVAPATGATGSGPKLVMFADLHLERQFAWAGEAAAARRRQALRQTLTNVVELAVDEQADALLCGGDLYENEFFTPDTLNFVRETVDCGLPVLFAPGNHDPYTATSLYRRVEWPSNVHIFSEPHFVPHALADGVSVWGAAHLAPTGTDGFFERFGGVDRAGLNVALFHGSETAGFDQQGSSKVAHAPFRAAQVAQAGFDWAFVGHFHQPTVGSHHCYPGNPDPLEFGEGGARGAVVATVDDRGAVSVEHRSVGATTVHDLTIDVSGCATSTALVGLVSDRLSSVEGYVRIDLVGELHLDLEYERSLLAGLDAEFAAVEGLVVRDVGLRRAYDLDEVRAESASVRAEFVTLVERSDLPDADKELIIELGLRAFDGRRDLEVV